MLEKLDKLAQSYAPVDGVCMRLLPYRPVFWSAQLDRFQKFIDGRGETWSVFHNAFILTAPILTAVNISGEVPVWAQALRMWFEVRTGDVIEDWLTFEQIIPDELAAILMNAYNATRHDVPAAPEALQQPAPVPVDNNGDISRPIKAGGKK